MLTLFALAADIAKTKYPPNMCFTVRRWSGGAMVLAGASYNLEYRQEPTALAADAEAQ